MGIIKKLKNLFHKGSQSEIEHIQEELCNQEVDYVEPVKEAETSTGLTCEHCGMEIFGNQKVKTYNAKKYHLKPCFRDLMKEAKSIARGMS